MDEQQITGVDADDKNEEEHTTGVDGNSDTNEQAYQAPGNGIQMNLRSKPRREYNIFSQDDELNREKMVRLQFNQNME